MPPTKRAIIFTPSMDLNGTCFYFLFFPQDEEFLYHVSIILVSDPVETWGNDLSEINSF